MVIHEGERDAQQPRVLPAGVDYGGFDHPGRADPLRAYSLSLIAASKPSLTAGGATGFDSRRMDSNSPETPDSSTVAMPQKRVRTMDRKYDPNEAKREAYPTDPTVSAGPCPEPSDARVQHESPAKSSYGPCRESGRRVMARICEQLRKRAADLELIAASMPLELTCEQDEALWNLAMVVK